MSADALRRRALLVAVSAGDGDPGKLSVSHAVDRVAEILARRFGFEIERCTDAAATRRGIIESLDRWAAGCRVDAVDVCLLYYFGHAGRVRFVDLPTAADEVFGYVTCRRFEAKDDDGVQPFEGVLGCELSARLSALANSKHSVVVILDCCYAGQLVREGRSVDTIRRASAPGWVREFFTQPHDSLAVESHPDIVRLAGSTPKRESFARTVTRGEIGFMSAALLEVIEEFGDNCTHLSWDALTHRVRQRVVDEVGEGQWVSFAGPRERMLFSSVDAPLPRTVGLVTDAAVPHRAWLRIGALQGVEIGDRWAVVDPFVEAGQPSRALAVGTVSTVELNRAQLEFESRVDVGQLRSNAAELVAAERRVGVEVDDNFRECMRASPWLRSTMGGEASWRIDWNGSEISVTDRGGTWPTFRLPTSVDPGHAVELLEDRTRSERLLLALSMLARDSGGRCLAELPVVWSWGVVGHDGELPVANATVFSDDRLWFRFELRSTRALHWFIHVIHIDAAGRAWLLNTRVPHGLELERDDCEWLGLRPGASRSGLGLPWTPGQPTSGAAKIVLLATSLPLELSHLVRGADESRADAYAMCGVRPKRATGSRRRGSRPPELLPRWAFEVIEIEVHSNCRRDRAHWSGRP